MNSPAPALAGLDMCLIGDCSADIHPTTPENRNKLHILTSPHVYHTHQVPFQVKSHPISGGPEGGE